MVLSYALQPYYEESPIHLFCSLSSFSHLAGISGVGDEKIIKRLILQIVKKKNRGEAKRVGWRLRLYPKLYFMGVETATLCFRPRRSSFLLLSLSLARPTTHRSVRLRLDFAASLPGISDDDAIMRRQRWNVKEVEHEEVSSAETGILRAGCVKWQLLALTAGE